MRRYSARVHALRWILPQDLALPISDPTPYLLLHLDAPGSIDSRPRSAESHANASKGHGFDIDDALIGEATRHCSLQPWSDPQWLKNMRHWIFSHLPDRIRTISQLRLANAGAVLRIDTDRSSYFLKSVPSFLASEVALVELFHRRFPTCTPWVLDRSPDPNTHITRNIHGRALSGIDQINLWKRALRGVAEIQTNAASLVDEIEHIGVACRPTREFARGLERDIAELIRRQLDLPDRIRGEELFLVRDLIAEAKQDCDTLLSCGLPDTIINTDMNESNIFMTFSGQTVLIDWTFCLISHPFLALEGPLFSLKRPSHRMHPFFQELRHAYLEPWQRYTKGDVHLKAIDAASRLVSIVPMLEMVRHLPALHKEEPGHLLSLPRLLRGALAAYGMAHQSS
jgi:hypothetical protein